MSQVSSFIFGCPGCQKEFKVLAEFAGEVVQCPHCAQKIRIPASFFEELESVSPFPEKTNETDPQSPSGASAPSSLKAERQKPVQNRTVPGRASVTASSKEPPSRIGNAENSPAGPGDSTCVPKSPPSPKENTATASGRVSSAAKQENKSFNDDKIRIPDADAGEAESKPDSEKLVRSASAGHSNLPPEFSGRLESKLKVESAGDPLPNHPGLPPVFSTAVVEPQSPNSGSAMTGVAEPPSRADENEIDPVIAAKLPPRFEAEDPTKVRTGRDQGTRVFLPTAEGGIQTVDQRTVTVEYRGQKYVLIAMSPEEKRKRAIISNILSILIAILAIALTLWILI